MLRRSERLPVRSSCAVNKRDYVSLWVKYAPGGRKTAYKQYDCPKYLLSPKYRQHWFLWFLLLISLNTGQAITTFGLFCFVQRMQSNKTMFITFLWNLNVNNWSWINQFISDRQVCFLYSSALSDQNICIWKKKLTIESFWIHFKSWKCWRCSLRTDILHRRNTHLWVARLL